MEYHLRKIDRTVWNKFKSQLALEGKSIREALLEFIEGYNEIKEANPYILTESELERSEQLIHQR